MLPIQERPLLRIGEVILVLDEQYLIERATQGLYWFVHEKERELDGQRGWRRWNGAYANMVERRVEDQLRRVTPPLIGGSGSAFFTEEDLQAAFPRSKNERRRDRLRRADPAGRGSHHPGRPRDPRERRRRRVSTRTSRSSS